MDITFTTTPRLEALRQEVKAWLDDALPPELEGFQWDFQLSSRRSKFWENQLGVRSYEELVADALA